MANLHSRRVRGNLLYYDTHRKRIVDAIGADVHKYILSPRDVQPVGATGTDPSGWTSTVVEVGAGTSEVAGVDAVGAIARVTTAANENDGFSMQLGGEAFELTSDQDIYVGMECAINDADQTDLLFGLCITDTALLGGMTDGIYFEKLDAAATLSFTLEKDSTETQADTLGTFVDATFHTIEFYWDGAGVEAFFDGASVSTPAVTNLPDNEFLRLSLEFLTGEATANTLDIRWLRAFQIGR